MVVTRKTKKAATRVALKDAAMRCFVEHGVAEVSVGAITKAAGVAHGTFYVHFESKDTLLYELLAEFNDGLALRLAPAWEEASPERLPALIAQTAAAFLDYWTERRAFVEAYAVHLAGSELRLANLRDGVNPPMTVLLTTHLQTLIPNPAVADLIVQSLLAMWARVGMQVLFNPVIERDVAEPTLVAMTLGALNGALVSL